MDEQRKYAVLFSATFLAVWRLNEVGACSTVRYFFGRPPFRISALAVSTAFTAAPLPRLTAARVAHWP